MKKTKKILSILLSCLMLMSLLSVGVFAAEGTQDNPINANDKWFGYGVDLFLLNTTLEPGDADGVWYNLVADQNNILQLENIYHDVDYQIYVTVNGKEYMAYENGGYNAPIITLPLSIGDQVLIHVIAQDTTQGGTVYLNGKFITGENNITQMVKLKNGNMKVWVAANSTVYFQDDSLQAEYATKGLLLAGSNIDESVVISVNKEYTDTDGDGVLEMVLGGSLGSAGAPAVKPSFAIQNNSSADAWYVLNLADTAHECNWDNDSDTDCNTCGAVREIAPACQHEYFYPCDATCMICGELTNPTASHSMLFVPATAATCIASGNIAFYTCNDCGGCWDNEQGVGMPLNRMMITIPATGEHTYDNDSDTDCNVCGAVREVTPDECAHQYDNDYDADCNLCGAVREVESVLKADEILGFDGNAVSETNSGLAFKFSAEVNHIAIADDYTADYADATVTIEGVEYTLLGMGAVLNNKNENGYDLNDVDGARILNIPALKVMEDENGYYYNIRITNIPDNHKDTQIIARPYYTYANAEGQAITVYDEEITISYNGAAG